MPRKKNPNNNYFNQAVEDAVCAYLSTNDSIEREKHFRIIYPALCKIAEVWYHKVKFSYSDDDMQDIMASCVAWLVEKMPMFKCGKGTKAFSYYTVTARFYYIQLANKNYNYFKKYIPLSSMNENWDIENSDVDDYLHSENARLLNDFIKYANHNIERILTKRLLKFGKVILDTMSNFEQIEDFRKRKVLQVIYKNSNCTESQKTNVTKAVNALASQFTLYKRRWESGDTSLNYISKNHLTLEEKQIVKDTLRIGIKNNGATSLARDFGVSVEVVMNYAKSI